MYSKQTPSKATYNKPIEKPTFKNEQILKPEIRQTIDSRKDMTGPTIFSATS